MSKLTPTLTRAVELPIKVWDAMEKARGTEPLFKYIEHALVGHLKAEPYYQGKHIEELKFDL